MPIKILSDTQTDITKLQSIKNEDISDVSITSSDVSFALSSKALKKSFQAPTDVRGDVSSKKFIVEFSSPNIAKPFHHGHLRSTIIGSFLSNLFKQFNHNVVKINYLGDYGTQFGFLKAGIDMENLSDEEIQKNPLHHLLRVYVIANSSQDPAIAEKARKIFEKMEFNEDHVLMNQWEKIRKYTLSELKTIYERLNIVYDVYEFESMYRRKNIEDIITQLADKKIIEKDAEEKFVVSVGDRKVPMIKSDNTTLYLTRDIAAFLTRKKKYQANKTFYVVDNGQNDHFTAIKSVVNQLGFDGDKNMQHVKFGRIRGM